MTEYEYQQIISLLISKYGINALDRLDYWELQELIEQEAERRDL